MSLGLEFFWSIGVVFVFFFNEKETTFPSIISFKNLNPFLAEGKIAYWQYARRKSFLYAHFLMFASLLFCNSFRPDRCSQLLGFLLSDETKWSPAQFRVVGAAMSSIMEGLLLLFYGGEGKMGGWLCSEWEWWLLEPLGDVCLERCQGWLVHMVSSCKVLGALYHNQALWQCFVPFGHAVPSLGNAQLAQSIISARCLYDNTGEQALSPGLCRKMPWLKLNDQMVGL